MKNLDQPWKDWVRLNLQRGCSRQELFQILIREGFDRDAAALEVSRRAILIPNPQPLESALVELYTAEAFLRRQECEALIVLMAGRLRESTITTAEEPDRYFRRSKTCDLSFLDDPVIHAVDRRICAALQIDPALAEPTQAQHYDVGDEFARGGRRNRISQRRTGGAAQDRPRRPLEQPAPGRPAQPAQHPPRHAGQGGGGGKAIITKWFRAPRSRAC